MPKLRLGPCQSQPYRQPRSRIESLEGLSVPLVCGHRLCPLIGCRCHTTASQGHATSCVSRSRPCWVLGVLEAMPREGSQVQCALRQLLVRALPGAAGPSRSQHLLVVVLLEGARRFTCASTGSANLHWYHHVSWFYPAFQVVVLSNCVHQHFSSFFLP